MDHEDDYIERAILPALVLTLISFFNGGVFYGTPLPIWAQLARNFLIYCTSIAGSNFVVTWCRRKWRIWRDRRRDQ